MKRKSPLCLAIFATAVISSFAISGCTINVNVGPENAQQSEISGSSTEYSAEEVMFAQMMIPHHEQALEMSQLALSVSTYSKILDLAQRIFDGQAPEIEEMQSWIDTSGVATGMAHDMPDGSVMNNNMMDHGRMSGMVSAEQMEELASLQSPEFDVLFLQLMIEHHEGALEMVEMIENSENEEVKKLVTEIVEAQTREIEEMRTLLQSLTSS
jgi:uncharacterized protein (DUF305 family)